MYLGSDAANFALLLARVWIAIMIFAHGWRHVKSIRSGPGHGELVREPRPEARPAPRVDWSPSPRSSSRSLLVLGFLTPLAYGGVCALMLVALLTNHLQERLLPEQRQGGLRVRRSRIAVLSITLGTLGPGKWSLDHAFDFAFPFDPKKALLVTAIVGIGGAAAVPRARSGVRRRRTDAAS